MAVETNWKNFLSEDSELPLDVSICVKGDKQEGGQIFRTHKTLLADVSPLPSVQEANLRAHEGGGGGKGDRPWCLGSWTLNFLALHKNR